MVIKKTFEEWLQQFNSAIHIMIHATNPDIDVLYLGDEILCSIPKGLAKNKFWTEHIAEHRKDRGYVTSDGIPHRSLSGVGLVLLGRNIITDQEFVRYFMPPEQREMLRQAVLKIK